MRNDCLRPMWAAAPGGGSSGETATLLPGELDVELPPLLLLLLPEDSFVFSRKKLQRKYVWLVHTLSAFFPATRAETAVGGNSRRTHMFLRGVSLSGVCVTLAGLTMSSSRMRRVTGVSGSDPVVELRGR